MSENSDRIRELGQAAAAAHPIRKDGSLAREIHNLPIPRDPVERYLFAALEQYPGNNPQRTQAAKICAGVLKLAREMADNDLENWQ